MKLILLLIILSIFLVSCSPNQPEPTRTLLTLKVDVFPMDIVNIPITSESTCYYFDDYIICKIEKNISVVDVK